MTEIRNVCKIMIRTPERANSDLHRMTGYYDVAVDLILLALNMGH